MLTTPPGPYLVTLALRPFMQVLGFFRACDDVMAIRSTNVLALLSLPLLCMQAVSYTHLRAHET